MILEQAGQVVPDRLLWSRENGFTGAEWAQRRSGLRPSALRIEAVDGVGELVGWSGYQDTTFYVGAPGSYQISINDLPGFRPVPPHVVTLHSGAVSEVKIELTRE